MTSRRRYTNKELNELYEIATQEVLKWNLPETTSKKLDWGEMNNDYWLTYFFTPDDDVTDRYNKSMEYWLDKLPASFTDGLGNKELFDKYYKPIKQVVSFKSLEKGDYETQGSKSDKNIAKVILFFVRNLPSFKQYKDTDNLSWMINQHRLLITEILEQGEKNKLSTATIKTRFNAIARITRIAYGGKSYELYQKFSAMVLQIGEFLSQSDKDNKLNEFEKTKFINWNFVLQKQMELEIAFKFMENKKTTKAYDLNNDLLLISLYSLRPPLRNEVKHLEFTTTTKRKGDYIFFKNDEVFLDLNEEKKRHDAILFNLSEESPKLAELLKESYKLYPRKYVFTIKGKYPDVSKKASEGSLDNRLVDMFKPNFPDLNVSVNSLRSSYVSYRYFEAVSKGTLLTGNEKEKIAKQMRTSVKYMDEAYLKIPDKPVIQPIRRNVAIPALPAPRQPQVEEISSYQKQLNRNKKYYEENKEKILSQQKGYQQSRSAFDKSRVKILHFLNNDPSYENRIRKATMDKYNFKKNGNVWK
jgi:hypothetical protein